ncbi:unnamed protein product [Allacma fusca]|uniref:Uncharacterized protein n=1 Tax=Allacma fusca TaxID=39272 RepID=A0A8J2LK62_9HEXA|nr:unnamed protein product [Allacma fusca]
MDPPKPKTRLLRQNTSVEKDLGELWIKAKHLYHEEFKQDFTALKEEAVAKASTAKPLKYEKQLEDIHRKVISTVLQCMESEEGLEVEQRRKLRGSLDFQRENVGNFEGHWIFSERSIGTNFGFTSTPRPGPPLE